MPAQSAFRSISCEKNFGGKPMKWRFGSLGPVVLALCVFALPLHAQTSDTTKPVVHPRYDITQEMTFTGTVSSVVAATAHETKKAGVAHVMVQTTSGTVEADLGRYAMRGEGALKVTPGQPIQLTGVMKTVRGQQVLITRLVQANGKVYKVRNEHGFVYHPVARKNQTKSETKGGQL
jgi:DNA/RNA endonuclease YhcR with UshA esterase domain